jgi:RimJ/RimL family protein N-acetyltransferase
MGEPTLRLRATTLTELGFVLALEADDDVEPFIPPWPGTRHADAIAAADEAHFLVVAGTRPVGFVLLAGLLEDRPHVELRRIAVSPRGMGFARRTLELALDCAFGTLGADLVWLDVLPDNARAQRAYAAAGFARDSALREALLAAGRGPIASGRVGGTGSLTSAPAEAQSRRVRMGSDRDNSRAGVVIGRALSGSLTGRS